MVSSRLRLPKNYFLYVAVFTAHTGAFLAGTSMTWSSPIFPKLLNLEDNPLGRTITLTEMSLLGSIPTASAAIGIVLTGYLAKVYGRKPSLFVLGIPSVISYLMLAISTNIWMLYIARFISGIIIGGILTIDAMYFAEVAENKNRGLLGTAMVTFMNVGLLIPLVIGPWTSFFWYHIILSIFPVLYMVQVFLFVPESPYFLVQKDYQKAETSLSKLRGTRDVKMELDDIKKNLEEEKKVPLSQVLNNKGLKKGLIIGCGLIIFQQLCGVNVIATYCQLLLEGVPGGVSSAVGPVIVVGLQSAVCLITPLFIDRYRRKIFLMISHIGMILAQIMFGVYFYMKDEGEDVSELSWLPLVSLIVCNVFYSIGSGPIPWSIVGELFPLDVKEVATSVCGAANMTFTFMMMFAFNYLLNFVGKAGTFWLFSFFGILATVFVQFYVIETKGKSLAEIQKILNC